MIPTLTYRIAFASNPLDAPVWSDVSAYVRNDQPITITRGRQHELQLPEAGTATIVLDNSQRDFDPVNTGSPYYPYVIPRRRNNIRATYGGITYDMHTGYVETWTPTWEIYDSIVQLESCDAFKLFANNKISLVRGQELSSARISALLTAVSWPIADRLIATGQSEVQAVNLTREVILQHLLDVIDAENGLAFMDGAGRLVFQDRHYRLGESSAGVFGDGAGELPYTEIEPSFDDSLIYNDISVTRIGGAEQTATDATSQAEYFTSTYQKTDMLITTDSEAAGAASWLLTLYKEPKLRIKTIKLDGYSSPALWEHILGREISDRITVRKRPPGGGLIEEDYFIDAIHHQITASSWECTWSLMPATSTNFLTFDDPVLGQFDFNVFGY